MKSRPLPSLGHVVMEYDIPWGPHIQICDDYCRDVTPEEIEACKDRLAKIIAKELINEYTKKEN